jgi:hypothetical protein
MRRLVVLVAAVALVACSSEEVVPPGGARTFYEALDLSTPKSAAETFLDAFARDDFMTVWLTLSPLQHDSVHNALYREEAQAVVNKDAIPPAEVEEIFTSSSPVAAETLFLFDALMLSAGRHDAFVLDVSGPVRITDETMEDGGATLTLEGEGLDGPVTLWMSDHPSGDWRVLEVTVGDPEEPETTWPRRPPW